LQRNVRFLAAMQDRGRFSQWPHCRKTGLSTAEASVTATRVNQPLGQSDLTDCFWPGPAVRRPSRISI
jgi:hypothetical protein